MKQGKKELKPLLKTDLKMRIGRWLEYSMNTFR
jgi:hypothetical protein